MSNLITKAIAKVKRLSTETISVYVVNALITLDKYQPDLNIGLNEKGELAVQFPGQFPAEHILVSFMFSPEYQAEETLLEQAESYLKNIDITNEFEDAINDFYELI